MIPDFAAAISQIDHEALLHESARRLEVRRQGEREFLANNPQAFVGASLGAWLEAAKMAGVPYVPASQIYEIERDAVLEVGGGKPSQEQMTQWLILQEALANVPPTHMVRWDACAGVDLKMGMSKGMSHYSTVQLIEDRGTLSADDPRAYDILFLSPTEVMPVWSRPWVKPIIVDDFPLEFRVFVRDSQVLGVANYYLQRDLPSPEGSDDALIKLGRKVMDYALQAKAMGDSVVAALSQAGRFAWMPDYERNGFAIQEGLIHGTMDFLVDQEGHLLFLEAGPPFGAGAHPCAFKDQKEISGVALADNRPPLPFSSHSRTPSKPQQ